MEGQISYFDFTLEKESSGLLSWFEVFLFDLQETSFSLVKWWVIVM